MAESCKQLPIPKDCELEKIANDLMKALVPEDNLTRIPDDNLTKIPEDPELKEIIQGLKSLVDKEKLANETNKSKKETTADKTNKSKFVSKAKELQAIILQMKYALYQSRLALDYLSDNEDKKSLVAHQAVILKTYTQLFLNAANSV